MHIGVIDNPLLPFDQLQNTAFFAASGHVDVGLTGIRRVLIEGCESHRAANFDHEIIASKLIGAAVWLGEIFEQSGDKQFGLLPTPNIGHAATRPPTQTADIGFVGLTALKCFEIFLKEGHSFSVNNVHHGLFVHIQTLV